MFSGLSRPQTPERVLPGANPGGGQLFRLRNWRLLLVCFGLSVFSCLADYSVTLTPGVYYLLANQLDHTNDVGAIDNRIEAVIPVAPESTQAWDPAKGAYSAELFSVDNPGWSDPAWLLTPGRPLFFYLEPRYSTAPYTFRFTGSPHPIILPIRSPGENLWSRQSPGLGTFENIVGFSPCDGDQLFQLAPAPTAITYRGLPAFAFFYRHGKWSPRPPQLNVGEGAAIHFSQPCNPSSSCAISGVAPIAACRGAADLRLTVYGIGLPALGARIELTRGSYSTGKLPATPPDATLATNALSALFNTTSNMPAGFYTVRVFDAADNICAALSNAFQLKRTLCAQPLLAVRLLGRSQVAALKKNQFALFYRNIGDAPALNAAFTISCIPDSSKVTVDLISPNTTVTTALPPCGAGQAVRTLNPIPEIAPGASGYLLLDLTSLSVAPDSFNLVGRSFCCGSTVAQDSDSLHVEVVPTQGQNAVIGLASVGTTRSIIGADTLPFEILFENGPTAAVQQVTITSQIDLSTLDVATFRLGPIVFGNQVITPPPGLGPSLGHPVVSFSATAVYDADGNPDTTADDLVFQIDVSLTTEVYERSFGLVTWTLRAADASRGFLPPEGKGAVFFHVDPHSNLTTGDIITNSASIVFDTSAPLTRSWTNTVDQTEPTLQIIKQSNLAVISWTGVGILQSATDLTGNWFDLINAATPYTEEISGQKFYRLRE